MKRTALSVALAIGVAIGLWHLWFAAQATFVFRNGEQISSWLTILLGPGSTLMAIIVTFFSRRVGGYWLICSGLTSLAIFATTITGDSENLIHFTLQISAPMVLLGVAILFLTKEN